MRTIIVATENTDKPMYTVDKALSKPWLPLMRELVRANQAFSQYSDRHVKGLGLTPAQFDVLATLGNTAGMTFKELGEKTLLTKGSLTGIVDRMEGKGWVKRLGSSEDRRSVLVCLTTRGQRLFEKVFPAHLNQLTTAFGRISEQDQKDLERLLRKLREAF